MRAYSKTDDSINIWRTVMRFSSIRDRRSISNLPNSNVVFAAYFVHRALISSVISPDFGPTSSHLSPFFLLPTVWYHKSLNPADRPVSLPPLHISHPSLPLTIALGTRRFWTLIKRQGSLLRMAGKESPRISLLMATGRNYRLLGVKVNISMIVPPSGRAVLAIAIYIVIFFRPGHVHLSSTLRCPRSLILEIIT